MGPFLDSIPMQGKPSLGPTPSCSFYRSQFAL